MMGNDCDRTRDVIPLLNRGESTAQQAAAVTAHMETCDACRREQQIVLLIAAAAAEVPAGLEARVLDAVRVRPRRWAPARLALAATVAAAVIGGSMVFDRFGFPGTPQPAPGLLVLDDNSRPAVSWAVTDDALLQSGTALQQLSVEELELVLAELDS